MSEKKTTPFKTTLIDNFLQTKNYRKSPTAVKVEKE
jgi:hypothetical protein